MRLRLSQILDNKGMTAYGLAEASGGRISMSTAYRLANDEWDQLSRDTLDALCDVLAVQPGELFERDSKRGKR